MNSSRHTTARRKKVKHLALFEVEGTVVLTLAQKELQTRSSVRPGSLQLAESGSSRNPVPGAKVNFLNLLERCSRDEHPQQGTALDNSRFLDRILAATRGPISSRPGRLCETSSIGADSGGQWFSRVQCGVVRRPRSGTKTARRRVPIDKTTKTSPTSDQFISCTGFHQLQTPVCLSSTACNDETKVLHPRSRLNSFSPALSVLHKSKRTPAPPLSCHH